MIDPHNATWRISSRSSNNGACVETACLHDANWRKSSRSANNGQCVEVADLPTEIGIRDSKLDNSGDFPMLRMSANEWTGLLDGIKNGAIPG